MATLLDDEENLTEEERLQRELDAIAAQYTDAPPPAEDVQPQAPEAARDSIPQFPEGQRFSDPNNADTGKFTKLGSYTAEEAAAMADRNAGYDAQSLVQIKRMQGQAEFDRLVKSGVAPETAYRQTAGLLNYSDPKALAQGLHEVPAPRPLGPTIPDSLRAVPVIDPLTQKPIGHSIYDLTGKNHGFRSLQEEQASTVGEREVLKRRLSSAAKAEDEARKNLSFDVDGTAKAAYEDAKKARAEAEQALEGGYIKSSTPSLPPSVKLSKPKGSVYFGSKEGEPKAKPEAAPANEITARNPKTGEVLVYRNGKWVKP